MRLQSLFTPPPSAPLLRRQARMSYAGAISHSFNSAGASPPLSLRACSRSSSPSISPCPGSPSRDLRYSPALPYISWNVISQHTPFAPLYSEEGRDQEIG